jgi:hypothetical protein
MDNLHVRLNLNLSKEKGIKHNEIFGSKMVTIPARNTTTLKICKLRKAIFSVFYNIS